MGNNSGKNLLQFQAEVGRMESKRKLFNSYLFAGFIIIIGCVFVYLSFIPTLPISCYSNNEKQTAEAVCNNPNKDQKKCDDANTILSKKNHKCSVKTKNRSFLVGSVLLIFLAILYILYANWRNNFMQRNYLAAVTQGGNFELDATSKLLARVL
jgi:magnesium-transporting ATPase (P-type)